MHIYICIYIHTHAYIYIYIYINTYIVVHQYIYGNMSTNRMYIYTHTHIYIDIYIYVYIYIYMYQYIYRNITNTKLKHRRHVVRRRGCRQVQHINGILAPSGVVVGAARATNFPLAPDLRRVRELCDALYRDANWGVCRDYLL